MRVGDRVEFVASWSSYRGRYGTVKRTGPYLMVLIDSERLAVAASADEVRLAHEEISMTGAE